MFPADTHLVTGAPDKDTDRQRFGEITHTRAAFHASRLVLGVIFALSAATGSQTLGWSALLAAVVTLAGFSVSATFFVSRLRKGPGADAPAWIERIPSWAFVGIDAVIALGIILLVGGRAAPMAWIAVVVPVTEAALAYSLLPAAGVWLALSLAHLAFVLSTHQETTTLFLALQQLLAVLLVGVPASYLATSVRDEITALTADRERATTQTTQLETVALRAENMSDLADSTAVLREAVASMVRVGFDQADLVAGYEDGWRVVARHHRANLSPIPEHILSTEAEATAKVFILRPDCDSSRQILHTTGMEWGCATSIDAPGFDDGLVLRAWSSVPILDEPQAIRVFSLLAKQITNIHNNAVASERAATESARLSYQAAHDRLTGVANHGSIMEALHRLSLTSDRTSVFFLDLDGFKPINDTLGHKAGNQALIIVSRRLEDLVGPHGVVGRMGGDEFIVVGESERLTLDGAEFGLANIIYDTISEPMTIEGRVVSVGASVGATSGGQEISPDELVRQADAAMYVAKRAGGGAVRWQPALDSHQLSASASNAYPLITGDSHSVMANNDRGGADSAWL